MLSSNEKRDLAEGVVRDQVNDIEFTSVVELVTDTWGYGEDVTDGELEEIHDLAMDAGVEVTIHG